MSESASGKAVSSYSPSDKELTCDICGDTLSDPSHVTRHKRLKHPEQLDHDCPSCDDTFSTERGLKLHHKRTHGETLTVETSECKQCGREFSHRDNLDPHTCSTECRDEWQTGENAANWKGGKVTSTCEWCGEEYKTHENKADSQRFCGQSCQRRWHPEHFSGENNPVWKGGKTRYYGPSWYKQRRKARERDDHTCQSCGVTKEEYGRSMSVHHIIPFREFGVDRHEEANRLSNLVSLCRECHRKYEGMYIRPDNRGGSE